MRSHYNYVLDSQICFHVRQLFVFCSEPVGSKSAPWPVTTPRWHAGGADPRGRTDARGTDARGLLSSEYTYWGGGLSSSKELFQELVALHANCYEWN